MLGAADLLGPLGGFAASIVHARTLGPSGRGDLAAVVAALAVCEAVLVFGIPDVMTRHVARVRMFTRSFTGMLIVCLLGSTIPAVLVWWWAVDRVLSAAAAGIAAAVGPTATVAALRRRILAGRRAFRRLVVVLMAGGVIRPIAPAALLLLFAVVQLGASIAGAAIVSVAIYAGMYGVALLLANRSVMYKSPGGKTS
ncbi:hypothetical protein IFT73_16850 [Aeromicrobium sp. CFBP 8757]|uniref:hypothetical protein n=1 Tax=Aeromicrobium sp. CFBP 8757 TaxID=2775288 RepID=UPI001785FB07|nr:hypothetical protein [Aeromicrobium sp. CFBP 8757]MBD8608526.1 hypothetical protein [Aeromicrobium sp. CFBP 8757]